MRITLDFQKPIADALSIAANRYGEEVIDLVVEAVRSSDIVQHALRDAYPTELTTFLQSEAHA